MMIKTVLAGVALTLAFAVAPASAADLVFTLDNKTSGAVNELYVGPPESNTWGEDILGKDVLESGQTATITILNADGKCQWDVRIVYDDNSVTDERNIDICNLANATYELTD